MRIDMRGASCWARWLCSPLILFGVLALWVPPSRLWASCGDWLDGAHQGVHGLLRLAHYASNNSRKDHPVRLPCRGAECRRAPLDVPPVVPPHLPESERVGWYSIPSLVYLSPNITWLTILEELHWKIIFLEPPDPPPREPF